MDETRKDLPVEALEETPLSLDDGTDATTTPISGNGPSSTYDDGTSVKEGVLTTSHRDHDETQSTLDTTRVHFVETINEESSDRDVVNLQGDDDNVVQDVEEVVDQPTQLDETSGDTPNLVLKGNPVHLEEEGDDDDNTTTLMESFEHVDVAAGDEAPAPTDSEVVTVALELLEAVNQQMKNITQSGDNESTSTSTSDLSARAGGAEEPSPLLGALCHAVRRALDLGRTEQCPRCGRVVFLHPNSKFVTCSNVCCGCRWCIACGEAHNQFSTCGTFDRKLQRTVSPPLQLRNANGGSHSMFDVEQFHRERALYFVRQIKQCVPLDLWRQLTEKFRLVTTTENIPWGAVDRAAIPLYGSTLGTKMTEILLELRFQLRKIASPYAPLPSLKIRQDVVQYYDAPQQRQRGAELVMITVFVAVFAFGVVMYRGRK